MKFTAEQMEKLIRAERKETVKALNDAEKAYNADKKSVKKREVYQYTFAQVEAIDNLCDLLEIYFDDEIEEE